MKQKHNINLSSLIDFSLKNEILKEFLPNDINETSSEIEKILYLFIAKASYEKDKKNYEFNNNFDIEIKNKLSFSSLCSSITKKTIKEILEALWDKIQNLNAMKGKNLYKDIKKEIEAIKSHYEYIYSILKGMKKLNKKYNFYNSTIRDKGKLLKIIFYSFCFIRKKLQFKEQENKNISKNAIIISVLFERFLNNPIINDSNFFFGALKEEFSKFKSKSFDIDISEKSNIGQMKNIINTILNEELKDKTIEDIICNYDNKDEIINIELVYNSFLIEDFEIKNTKKKNNINLYESSAKITLDKFVRDIKTYEFLDIYILTQRYLPNAKQFLFQTYEILFDSFQAKINKETKDKINEQTNLSIEENTPYSIQKQLFIKFFYLILINQSFPFNDICVLVENIQILSYYSYITLQYIENRKLLIEIVKNLLIDIQKTKLLSIITTHHIIAILVQLRKILPFNIVNIIKKYSHDIISYSLLREESILFTTILSDSDMLIISKDFYLYCYEISNSLCSKFNFQYEKREKIFNQLIKVVNYNKGALIKNKLIDEIILVIFALENDDMNNKDIQLIFKEGNFMKIYSVVKLKYFEEKRKTLLPEICELLITDSVTSFDIGEIFGIICKDVNININMNKEQILPCIIEYKSFIFETTKDYNTIFAYYPNGKYEFQNDILNRKRIRVLTPNIIEKKILTSPFVSNGIYIKKNQNGRNVSAFKNLSFDFQN